MTAFTGSETLNQVVTTSKGTQYKCVDATNKVFELVGGGTAVNSATVNDQLASGSQSNYAFAIPSTVKTIDFYSTLLCTTANVLLQFSFDGGTTWSTGLVYQNNIDFGRNDGFAGAALQLSNGFYLTYASNSGLGRPATSRGVIFPGSATVGPTLINTMGCQTPSGVYTVDVWGFLDAFAGVRPTNMRIITADNSNFTAGGILRVNMI